VENLVAPVPKLFGNEMARNESGGAEIAAQKSCGLWSDTR